MINKGIVTKLRSRFGVFRTRQVIDESINVLVIGKAKTGTTFLAKLIQNSLEDCDLSMEPKGTEALLYRQYPKNLVVKIIFEHYELKPNLRRAMVTNELPLVYDKRLVIVRDPRDELISRLLYQVRPLADLGRLDDPLLDEWVALLRKKEKIPTKVTFRSLIKTMDRLFGTDFLSSFRRYVSDFSDFIDQGLPGVHFVRYEDLVDHKFADTEEYLGVQLNPNFENDQFIDRTLRSGTYGNWRSFFCESDIEYLYPILSPITEKLRYKEWSVVDSPSIDPTICSKYVENLGRQGMSLYAKSLLD